MSKPVLLIGKGGSTFRTRGCNKMASANGEQGETEGLIRHLAARTDIRLIYFGTVQGELPCEVLTPCIDGFNEYTEGKEQEEGWRQDIVNLSNLMGDDEPIGFVHVAGYSPTFSWINNPRAATVQACSIRYQSPQLNIIQSFELPRLVINNDPRTYPKDQEMSYGWDHCRPAALLDQWDCDKTMVVGGKKYRRRSVHAYCESWGYLPEVENIGEKECIVLAHAHVHNGIGESSWEPWKIVLSGNNYDVYGDGWDEFPYSFSRDRFKGKVKASAVQPLLSTAMCCPVVAHTPGFYTGKPYMLMSAGCLPILYGKGGDPHTADPKGALLGYDSQFRIVAESDLTRIVRDLRKNDSLREEYREYWKEAVQPAWDVLNLMIDDLLDGIDTNSDSWFDLYGGYRPI